MNNLRAPKKQPELDWHRADIVAALRKAGWSLRRLSTHHGYATPTALINALNRPWPKGERLIAAAIGVHPWEIWPSRYDDDGRPNRGKGGRKRVLNSTTAPHQDTPDEAA